MVYVLTGLYYRSPELYYFLLAFSVDGDFVFVAVPHIIKSSFYKFVFLVQVFGVGYIPFVTFKVDKVRVDLSFL